MTIENKVIRKDSHTTFIGPAATRMFSIAALIKALELEEKGIKVIRGRSALSVAKLHTGLRTNKRATHIATLRVQVDRLKAECGFEDHTS